MLSRAFNTVTVDKTSTILTKTSSNIQKLKDEVDFYLNLPKSIRPLFPRLLRYQKDYSAYDLEYIPYENLSELILSNKISTFGVKNVFKNLFEILHNFHKFHPTTSFPIYSIKEFYIQKTLDRVKDLEKNPELKELLSCPEIIINGKRYENFSHLQEKFIHAIEELPIPYSHITLIHGDFCFSNILCDLQGNHVKLIDPRGSFGKKGLYGHSYYDYAKLLHCLHGHYDDIVHDRFTLIENASNAFSLHVFSSTLSLELFSFFKNLLETYEIDLNILYLIEASLFLSMAALHYENKQHQKAFYLTGLMILNSFFEGQYENLH